MAEGGSPLVEQGGHYFRPGDERRVDAGVDGINLGCPGCRRLGYPPSHVGVLAWNGERGRWDAWAFVRARGTQTIRRSFLILPRGPAPLRCYRCGWREDWKANTLARQAEAQGIEPGSGLLLYPGF